MTNMLLMMLNDTVINISINEHGANVILILLKVTVIKRIRIFYDITRLAIIFRLFSFL